MNKLYDDLIKQLIEIGRSEVIPSIPDSEFSYLREGQWQRSRYPEDCDNYSYEELKPLFKGLVLCEKHFEWFVGSATNTAWVLRNIEERLDLDYEEIKELYDFGLANRGKNPYAPTGSFFLFLTIFIPLSHLYFCNRTFANRYMFTDLLFSTFIEQNLIAIWQVIYEITLAFLLTIFKVFDFLSFFRSLIFQFS
jgi:hypothetical protein